MRKKYDKSFKIYAVTEVLNGNKKVTEVARELNLVPQTLHKWVQAYKTDKNNAFLGSGNRKNTKNRYIQELEEENAILKKSIHLSDNKNKIYDFIHKHKDEFPIKKMCDLLKVSKSGYYSWEGRSQSDQERRKKYLTSQIKQIYLKNDGRIGSPKITNLLNKNGTKVSQKTVYRILLENKNKWINNYTAYSHDIGLASGGRYLKSNTNVVLDFPFKDCTLNNSSDSFLHNVIAKDQIDDILAPKVFNNIKRYDVNGVHEISSFKETDNLIVKGDNLIALHTLKTRFKNKVKLVYIDPPYNTGNYHLKYNDYFSHNEYLVFIKNRLDVSRELLRNDGAIYIHCDDKEQAYLKVLCDEIFGRENFVTQIVWRRTESQQNTSQIANVTDYIMIFAKDKRKYRINKMPLSEDAYKAYKFEDVNGKFRLDKVLDRSGYYTYGVLTPKGNKLHGPWVYKESTFRKLNTSGNIYWSKANEVPYKKGYLKDDVKQIPINFWGTEYGTNQQSSREIKNLFGKRVFIYPKPELLMYHILKIGSDVNDIVLDFFMGSATTQAVAHKMKRQYIGIEKMDYINTVSVPRLQKVIEGEQGGISKKIEWQGGGSFVYAELDE
ncbi:DNA methyltransferase [Oceanobacillus sp. Castelsardo]|uniref:DNA methyltransferase n=1 Tax=Oceanobacillus sp. Castelsardo TaxID=1851204 RepID=UPI0008395370|nr:DNA methyltransferase [Oceanobacillus sp. Castelsardo]